MKFISKSFFKDSESRLKETDRLSKQLTAMATLRPDCHYVTFEISIKGFGREFIFVERVKEHFEHPDNFMVYKRSFKTSNQRFGFADLNGFRHMDGKAKKVFCYSILHLN